MIDIHTEGPHEEKIARNLLLADFKFLKKELRAARLVIKAVRDDEQRQPWFVLEALEKYDEVVK